MNTQKKPSDQELVHRSVNGDREAYGDLYERYLDQIYRYIAYRVPTVEEAEDLTESTFLHVWKDLRARKRKTEIRNFSAWLYRVAHNLVIDHHRKKRPAQIYQDTTSQITQTAIPGTEEVVISKIDNQILANALEKLEATAQNVIILRFFNGLSHGETAEALELNEGNVRVIQYRALKRLREILNKDNYD